MKNQEQIQKLEQEWLENPRWNGIKRPYSAEEVLKLRGSYKLDYTIAQLMSEKLWKKLNNQDFVAGLGALTGNQAVQEVDAGLEAIYLSGWQVAADANLSGEMYPDQSLYPANSVPSVVKKINNALLRADQIQTVNNVDEVNRKEYLVPIVADAEAGFGGNLNAFELMKQMIEAGAAGVHFEDQLSSAKKCGHLGGKVLVPTQEAINKLIAARLAADVCGVPTVLVARTDADAADLLTSDIDERDHKFITGERTSEGFYYVKNGVEQGIDRGLSYAPYADLIWMETSNPDLDYARKFAEGIHAKFPGKMLAYNCSPSFNWAAKLSVAEMETFREELAKMGYKFQFITLAGFHALNTSMFELALAYKKRGMAGYSELQEREFALQKEGFRAVKHQSFVGTSYFDQIQTVVTSGNASTTALAGSTEAEQFH
ncbi:MAG: isocitrate lyase [Flavobacteriales bacterium]|uniref:isocitrate lyase n=1 Tax=Candidatus Kaistella beijingensis TaxID=2820270 RepID=UPI0019E2BC5B|nr:isocitrate lyase [Candidatus Kaistella beijingensis]MBE2273494.1 isocitrate lyase [Flavobacteriales bacterium]MCA0391685.1 isocitrate lyase [Bacteroidota bacterium]HQD45586.1 isocitrate lyase [Kaistella sp.]MBN8623281.1 isocitrate lyase [Flavobacteriales bacterium]UBB89651.1 isocitrate lyase [Candidatus Kaistella beijingensis]